MTGDSNDYEMLHGTTIIERVIKIDQIISEPEVIQLKPKSRKCLFASEPQSKYFSVIMSSNVKRRSEFISSQLHRFTP